MLPVFPVLWHLQVAMPERPAREYKLQLMRHTVTVMLAEEGANPLLSCSSQSSTSFYIVEDIRTHSIPLSSACMSQQDIDIWDDCAACAT